MKFCPYCGERASDDSAFCTSCGKAINVRIKGVAEEVNEVGEDVVEEVNESAEVENTAADLYENARPDVEEPAADLNENGKADPENTCEADPENTCEAAGPEISSVPAVNVSNKDPEEAEKAADERPRNDLPLAIVGLALSCSTPLAAVAGLVIDLISLSKARKNAKGGPYKGKNKLARIFSIVGIPLAARAIVSAVLRLIILAGYIALIIFLAEVMRRDLYVSTQLGSMASSALDLLRSL